MESKPVNEHELAPAIGKLILKVVTELKSADALLTNICSDIRVYTISDVAKIFKCKDRTVKHHLYESRDLKYLIIGREVRILEKDLIEFLESRLMSCVVDREILP